MLLRVFWFNYVRRQPASAVTPAANWLEEVIDEIHAHIPDEAWAKVPPVHAADIDKPH